MIKLHQYDPAVPEGKGPELLAHPGAIASVRAFEDSTFGPRCFVLIGLTWFKVVESYETVCKMLEEAEAQQTEKVMS